MHRYQCVVRYAVAPSAFGYVLAAATGCGVCSAALGDNPTTLIDDLMRAFGHATLAHDEGTLNGWMDALSDYLRGERMSLDLPLDVAATPFQQEVWRVLRTIPYGTTQTYQQVAQRMGRPAATRAVAQACASNRVALIVPCHRVVRADGALGGYRWGVERKRALIAHEAAHADRW